MSDTYLTTKQKVLGTIGLAGTVAMAGKSVHHSRTSLKQADKTANYINRRQHPDLVDGKFTRDDVRSIIKHGSLQEKDLWRGSYQDPLVREIIKSEHTLARLGARLSGQEPPKIPKVEITRDRSLGKVLVHSEKAKKAAMIAGGIAAGTAALMAYHRKKQ